MQPAKAAKKAIAKAPKAIAKAPKAKAKAPKAKAKAEAPKAKAKRPLPLAPIGSYRDGSPRLLTPRAAKKPRGSFKIPLMKKTAATTAKQRTRWRQGGFST